MLVGRQGCRCAGKDGLREDICLPSSRSPEALLREWFGKVGAKCFRSCSDTGTVPTGLSLIAYALLKFVSYVCDEFLLFRSIWRRHLSLNFVEFS